jgi:glycosyltransferase involved in cell wall biosynthesis/SAM-dependent methyltransferase
VNVEEYARSSAALTRGPETSTVEDRRQSASVSIIITTYDHARFLGEAIESTLGQTVVPAEVIVIDDGSTDDPGAVIRRYPGVRLIRQSNQGLAAARNTGWRAACGQYVVFLDADDRLMPEALASNLQRFAERPDCAFAYGSFYRIDAGGRPLNSAEPQLVGKDPYESFLKTNLVSMHAAVMYRRDCLEEVGGFDACLRCCEDHELYLRLARRYGVAAGVERIAEYRHHDTNMSRNIPAMLGTVLAVMHRQSAYLNNNARWRKAYKTGIRFWKSNYAEQQISQTLAARTSGLMRVPWRATTKVFALAPATFLVIASRRILKTLRSRLARIRGVTAIGSRQAPVCKPVRFGDLRRLRPISPYFGYDRGNPVDRRYIEHFLSRHTEDIRGRVLEVGDNAYTMQYGGVRVTHSDILHVSSNNPKATLVGDLADGGHLPCEAFDCIVLTQTLQFVFDVHSAVATLHRMLKPGGVLLLTVPGVSTIDQEPNWSPLWTLSPTALRRLLEGRFDRASVTVATYGNVLAAVAFLHGLAEHELSPPELDTHDPQYPVIVAARAVKQWHA